LARFKIQSAEFGHRRQPFISRLQPVIRLRLNNETGQPVSRAYFLGEVRSDNRSVPWIHELFDYRIPGGVENGETVECGVEPNMFSAWSTEVPEDARFTVKTVRLDGPDGQLLWEIPDADPDQPDPDPVEELAAARAELAQLGNSHSE
jgi:hypothetical protein